MDNNNSLKNERHHDGDGFTIRERASVDTGADTRKPKLLSFARGATLDENFFVGRGFNSENTAASPFATAAPPSRVYVCVRRVRIVAPALASGQAKE